MSHQGVKKKVRGGYFQKNVVPRKWIPSTLQWIPKRTTSIKKMNRVSMVLRRVMTSFGISIHIKLHVADHTATDE